MSRVLVVDPERKLCELIRSNLQLDGHRVVLAYDRETALAASRQCCPEVATLEVAMGLDLVELVRDVRSSAADATDPTIGSDAGTGEAPAGQAPRIVVLTSNTDLLTRALCNLEGALRYINKPFSMGGLRHAVRDVMAEPLEEQLRRAHLAALGDIGLVEVRAAGRASAGAGHLAHPRLTRMEVVGARSVPPTVDSPAVLDRALLSPRLNEMLDAAVACASFPDAAESLGVSCTYLYSSIRRAARRVGIRTGPELLRQMRTGELLDRST